jgi:toxin HigB-1
VDIRYKSKKIQKICCDPKAARKAYGERMSKILSQRIDEMTAAESVEEMMRCRIGRCHLLMGDLKGKYALDLVHPYRLIFTQVGEDIQIAEIQEIIDYH